MSVLEWAKKNIGKGIEKHGKGVDKRSRMT